MLRAEPAVRPPEDTCRDDQVQMEEKINVQRCTAGGGDEPIRGQAQDREDSNWKTGTESRKEQQGKLYLPPRF